MKNRITELLNIKYPIIQGGMVWCSGWRLASAVSNNGGLGILGAGSMHPDVLREHIIKTQSATHNSFGVNIPLLYPEMEKIIDIIINSGVKIVFTSAGNPKTWTPIFKQNGIIVVHVVSSTFFAKKCEDAGVDAVVAEGFESGGHCGREETTTMSLIPNVKKNISIPLIAAGGISCGKSMAAAFCLGAEGVQIGSLFAVSQESSAHENFKKRVVDAKEGETVVTLKQLNPVRLIKNDFYEKVKLLDSKCSSIEEYINLLGKGRAKKSIFEGDLNEGEIEIGQVSSLIDDILPVETIISNLICEYNATVQTMSQSLMM